MPLTSGNRRKEVTIDEEFSKGLIFASFYFVNGGGVFCFAAGLSMNNKTH
jgi:hypothetical protein